MENSKLNICIPNYNYSRYLDLTLNSLYEQTDKNFRIYLSDNASTDNSLEVMKKWEPRFEEYAININKLNVGFGANLDKVTQNLPVGFTIMLSSDDIVQKTMVELYRKFISLIEKEFGHNKFIFGTPPVKIDENNQVINTIIKDKSLWNETDLDSDLTGKLGHRVYKVASNEMLNRCLKSYKTSLHFITTCYHSTQIEEIGSYGNSRMYNPDKWFNWRLLSNTKYIFFIETELFKYRWHSQNQFALQNSSAVLKYWVDEYRNSFEANENLIKIAGITREENINTFLQKCIYAYIVKHLTLRDFKVASRIFALGMFSYPEEMKKSKYFFPIKICLSNILLKNMASFFIGLIYPGKKNVY